MGYTFTITEAQTPVITVEQTAVPTITVQDENKTIVLTPPAAVNINVTATNYRFTATTDITQVVTQNLASSYRGVWSATTGYQRGDTVRYNDLIWVAQALISGNVDNPTPDADANWTLIFGSTTTGSFTTEQLLAITQAETFFQGSGGATNSITIAGVLYPTTPGRINQVLTTNGVNEAVWANVPNSRIASTTQTGIVRIGQGINVSSTGTISVNNTQTANINLNGKNIYSGTTSSNLTIKYYNSYGQSKPWVDINEMGLHLITSANPTYNVTEPFISINNQGTTQLAIDAFGNWTSDIKVGVAGNPYSANANIRFNGTNSGLILGTSTNYIQFGDGTRLYSATTASLYPATTTSTGFVKIGSGINVAPDGTISVAASTGSTYVLQTATSTTLGGVKIGTGWEYAGNGVWNVKNVGIATTTGTGVVKIGSGLNIGVDGTVSTKPIVYSTATGSTLGAIKVGTGLAIAADGTLRATYALNTATTSTLGGIILGNGLTADGTGKTSVDSTKFIAKANTITIGNSSTSFLNVENIAGVDGASAPLFPYGIIFPDLTVQTTAYTGNGGSGDAYTLPPATYTTLGGVKVGTGISVDGDGRITVNLPQTATTTTQGLVRIDGTTIVINTTTGVISAVNTTTPYSLPTASQSQLGGVKVGSSMAINNGILDFNYIGGLFRAEPTNYGYNYPTFNLAPDGITLATGREEIYSQGSPVSYINVLAGTSDNIIQVVRNSSTNHSSIIIDNTGTHISDEVKLNLNAPNIYATGALYINTITNADASDGPTFPYGIRFGDGSVQLTAGGSTGTGTTYVLSAATATRLGGVKIGSGVNVTSSGTISVTPYSLPQAAAEVLGGVKIAGGGLDILGDGTIEVNYTNAPHATTSTYGQVKIGSGISVADGVISATPASYTLPNASTSTLGGVKIGSNINLANDGTISVSTATTSTLGLVKIGTGITLNNGSISVSPYTLVTATTTQLGGVKIGSGLFIDASGVVSVTSTSTGGGTQYDQGLWTTSSVHFAGIGIGSTVTTITTSSGGVDANTLLDISFNGGLVVDLAGKVKNFTLSSPNGPTFTNTNHSGYQSLDFGTASNNRIVTFTTSSGNIDPGTGDFTVESWVYMPTWDSTTNASGTYYKCLFSWDSWSMMLVTGAGRNTGYNQWVPFIFHNGNGVTFPDTLYIPSNQWSHVAIGRKNGKIYFAVNGNVETRTYNTGGDYTDSTNIVLGSSKFGSFYSLGGQYNSSYAPGNFGFIGKIDSLRISNSARYATTGTATYTPQIFVGTYSSTTSTFHGYQLPANDGAQGQVLATDGYGNISWKSIVVGSTNPTGNIVNGGLVTDVGLSISDQGSLTLNVATTSTLGGVKIGTVEYGYNITPNGVLYSNLTPINGAGTTANYSINPSAYEGAGGIDFTFDLNANQEFNSVNYNGVLISSNLQTDVVASAVFDTFNVSEYNSAKYTIQIKDSGNYELLDVMVLCDGTDIYINESGILTNNGLLGTVDASLIDGVVSVSFNPTSATSMSIRTAITRMAQ